MISKRPLGISCIGYFYIAGAIILLLTLGAEQNIGMNIRFGVPFVPEVLVRIIISVFSIVMAYGYLKLMRWGFWTMIGYSILFLAVSLNQIAVYNSQPFIGNAVFSALVLFYTIHKKSSFALKTGR